MVKSKLSILVLARDQTIRMADMTSRLMDKYWNSRNAEFILCTQTQAPENSKYDRVIYTGEDVPWGERMLQAVEQIDSQYVLFTLEDFFPCDFIDNDVMEDYLQTMDLNSEISAIRLCPSKHFIDKYDEKYNCVKKGNPYRICGLPTIFRKDYLAALAEKKYSPWQFEIEGSEYSNSLPGEILVVKKQEFHCIHAWQHGYWTREVIPLFKKEGIDKSFYKNDKVYPLFKYIVGLMWDIGLDLFPDFFMNYTRKKNRQN